MYEQSGVSSQSEKTDRSPFIRGGEPHSQLLSSRLILGVLFAVDVVILAALVQVHPLGLRLHVAAILTALSLPIVVTRYLLAAMRASGEEPSEFPARNSFDGLATALDLAGPGATCGALLFCFFHLGWIAGAVFLVAGGLGLLALRLYVGAVDRARREGGV